MSKRRARAKWAHTTKEVQREIAIDIARKEGTIALLWPNAPRQFADTSDAFDFCREVNHPVHIYVADAENRANDRRFKLYPSGKMQDITDESAAL